MNFEELQMKRESCRVYGCGPLCPQRLQFPAVAFYPC